MRVINDPPPPKNNEDPLEMIMYQELCRAVIEERKLFLKDCKRIYGEIFRRLSHDSREAVAKDTEFTEIAHSMVNSYG